MIPDRFIVVCPEGHIDDFPIGAWIHMKSHKEWNKNTCMIKRSFGRSGGLASDITYTCSCGASGHMAEAMGKNALKKVGLKCLGKRPWLGNNNEDCESDPENLRVTLRGSTNIWFPISKSSIYIPSKIINRIPDEIFNLLKIAYDQAAVQSDTLLGMLLQESAANQGIEVDELVSEFTIRMKNQNDDAHRGIITHEMSEDEYRSVEYENLIRSSGEDNKEFHAKVIDISKYTNSIRRPFESITLVPKLRETRALVGFSRLEPREDIAISEAKKSLYLEKQNWLPAVTVYGEGLFFNFKTSIVEHWANQGCVKERIQRMNKAFQKKPLWGIHSEDLKAEFVLIHTFAHLMINQLSYECGYGSSALRERIYCEIGDKSHTMHGVLLYTAAGDSEGTLGGLVAQGKPNKLDDIVNSAIENARWCSSDPICIDSLGQGTDSCNLAACHNCALLPETSCELGNRILDRGLVIGTPDNPELGFFNYIAGIH
jgi:hypothetical protein